MAWADHCKEQFQLDAVPSAELYNRHNEWIRQIVPPGQLLEYQPSMGWGPLCHFLGVEAPKDTPFPRVNEAAYLRKVKAVAMVLGTVLWVALFAILGLGARQCL